jgi:hypothetical protein
MAKCHSSLDRARLLIIALPEHGSGLPAQHPRVLDTESARRPPDRPTALPLRVNDETRGARP